MKENTQKLLCWLADERVSTVESTENDAQPAAEHPYEITYQTVRKLLPDLTAGGRRSLIRYLNDQQLIRTQRLGQQTFISITDHGRKALSSELPVFRQDLRQWQGQWSCLTFLEAPHSDPGFRYLRQLLLDNQAFALSRGIYLYPGAFPTEVMQTCHNLYVGSIVIWQLKSWQFGDERRIINDQYMLSDVADLLSGISSEVNRLLVTIENKKRLSDGDQRQLFSVFYRLFEVLVNDPGITHYYFPQVPSGIQLLSQLRQIYSQAI